MSFDISPEFFNLKLGFMKEVAARAIKHFRGDSKDFADGDLPPSSLKEHKQLRQNSSSDLPTIKPKDPIADKNATMSFQPRPDRRSRGLFPFVSRSFFFFFFFFAYSSTGRGHRRVQSASGSGGASDKLPFPSHSPLAVGSYSPVDEEQDPIQRRKLKLREKTSSDGRNISRTSFRNFFAPSSPDADVPTEDVTSANTSSASGASAVSPQWQGSIARENTAPSMVTGPGTPIPGGGERGGAGQSRRKNLVNKLLTRARAGTKSNLFNVSSTSDVWEEESNSEETKEKYDSMIIHDSPDPVSKTTKESPRRRGAIRMDSMSTVVDGMESILDKIATVLQECQNPISELRAMDTELQEKCAESEKLYAEFSQKLHSVTQSTEVEDYEVFFEDLVTEYKANKIAFSKKDLERLDENLSAIEFVAFSSFRSTGYTMYILCAVFLLLGGALAYLF